MSTVNPTGLRNGMTGQLQGRRYTVLARVVMGMEEDGETWYWNEFLLRADDNTEATLVFEDTERGPVWRFFEYFEPASPFSVTEASRLLKGSSLTMDGMPGKVDLVGQAKVYKVEGQAPAEIQIGTLSRYFNATVDGNMLVVSWTHSEVEHYWGQDLTKAAVNAAFGVAENPSRQKPQYASALGNYRRSGDSSADGIKFALKILLPILAIAFMVGVPSCETTDSPSEVRLRKLPKESLKAGASFGHNQVSHSITEVRLAELATDGETLHGRLYIVSTPEGTQRTLLQGLAPSGVQWLLMSPPEVLLELSPTQAASLGKGARFPARNELLTVSCPFRLRIYSSDTAQASQPRLSLTQYGLFARTDSGKMVFILWNERQTFLHEPSVLKYEQLK